MHVPLDELESYLERERTNDRNLEFSTSLVSGEEVLIRNKSTAALDEYISIHHPGDAHEIGNLIRYSSRHLSMTVDENFRRQGIGTLMYKVRSAIYGLPHLESTGRLDRFLLNLRTGYIPLGVSSGFSGYYHRRTPEQINYEKLLTGEFMERFPDIRSIYPEHIGLMKKMFGITEKNLGCICVMGYSPEEALEFAQKIGFIGEKDSDDGLPKE